MEIRYFVKNSVTNAAFRDKVFYGANSTGQPYSAGYPNSAGTTAGPYDISAHEIRGLEDSATTITVTSGDLTVSVGDTILDSTFVGAYVYNIANPFSPVFLGVIASVTDSDTFESVSQITPGTYTFGYMKSNTVNFNNFRRGEAFYVLISVDNPSSITSSFPSIRGVTTNYSTATKTGDTDDTYIAMNRVSNPGVPNTSAVPVSVPCTVKRVNNFLGGNSANTYFKTNNDKPFWVCWEVNPYGDSSTKLSAYTRYSVEIDEDLPSTDVTLNFTYSSAENGFI